ncbi:hypothetical protein [Mycolicibacterium phlei]|jgi:hypothetical protein|uniref:hypothetical protein n=1 Tax=Mycolicibacterium phlei TaxID=1771 RepID=UPI00058EFF14|nr:hypothetical protein [Mycolicibacterium phlei]MBF4194681.1 hypothetical protein [Mycolicibacterium phlei]
MAKRLRLLHVIVQPVLVWDDGKELTPAPPMKEIALGLGQLSEFADKLPAQIDELTAHYNQIEE